MRDESIWQTEAIEQLSQFFHNEPDVKSFILSGSLASAKSEADVWSDVDAKIILADHALDRYYLSTGWLAPFGQLVGAERHENHLTRTLRVCLDDFRRFDLTFISESVLQEPALGEQNLFPSPYVVVWSTLPDIETRLASLSLPVQYQDISREELEKMVDAFWFKAATAMAKVVRNDLLIAFHLALDLARDSLVLQMIRRDHEKKTTVHRTGGWGNELVNRFSLNSQGNASEELLNFVQLSYSIFDELASELLPGYEYRAPLLFPTLERAKQVSHDRPQAGQ
ncbi:MAG TPA: aminoglycoside 6-adenylyltransferase [Anaerolineales bacterium]|nr:aminoglycoside 6-adenylyltransferase [Anaerolineales bacterium]